MLEIMPALIPTPMFGGESLSRATSPPKQRDNSMIDMDLADEST